MKTLETERLLLRAWKNEDVETYYQINQDPKVIEFLLGPMSKEQVEKFIVDKNQTLREENYTLWALEEKATGAMIGCIGIQEIPSLIPFAGKMEIAWRLGSQYWGNGYAPEGAHAVLDYAFETLGFEDIFSFTTTTNKRSQRVMEKIGMTHLPNSNFAHPKVPLDHPLLEHVLYRISAP